MEATDAAAMEKLPAAERKRLKKEAEAKRKEEEKEKKKAEQAAKQEAAGGAKAANMEELDPTKYRENRMAMVKAMKDPYPHKWPVNASIPRLIEQYKDMPAQTQEDGTEVVIAG